MIQIPSQLGCGVTELPYAGSAKQRSVMKKGAWAVVLIGVALIIGYVLIPTTNDLELTFWTRSGPFSWDDAEGATLYINEQPVGGPRVSFKIAELRQFFSSESAGTTRPPDKASLPEYDIRITPQLSFDVRVRPRNDSEPRVHTVFVRVVDGTDVVQGSFDVKAVDARGATAYLAGCKLVSKSVEDKRNSATVQVQLHF